MGKVFSPQLVAARAAPARVPAGHQLLGSSAGFTRSTSSWSQRRLGCQGTARYLDCTRQGGGRTPFAADEM